MKIHWFFNCYSASAMEMSCFQKMWSFFMWIYAFDYLFGPMTLGHRSIWTLSSWFKQKKTEKNGNRLTAFEQKNHIQKHMHFVSFRKLFRFRFTSITLLSIEGHRFMRPFKWKANQFHLLWNLPIFRSNILIQLNLYSSPLLSMTNNQRKLCADDRALKQLFLISLYRQPNLPFRSVYIKYTFSFISWNGKKVHWMNWSDIQLILFNGTYTVQRQKPTWEVDKKTTVSFYSYTSISINTD